MLRLLLPGIVQQYLLGRERLSRNRGPDGEPDLIVDDGGDEGVKAEEEYEKSGKLPDPSSTDNAEFQILLTLILHYIAMGSRLT
ncbi:Adenosylhomocysteinase-like protein [Drosera capensis]